ncbi:hypothetical protein T484DRAFT_2027766 [Baffinella frigidus]|nr:hypothetical protein T484DRAFT_2027766 [Cryptophyta sp. CCMP2293]
MASNSCTGAGPGGGGPGGSSLDGVGKHQAAGDGAAGGSAGGGSAGASGALAAGCRRRLGRCHGEAAAQPAHTAHGASARAAPLRHGGHRVDDCADRGARFRGRPPRVEKEAIRRMSSLMDAPDQSAWWACQADPTQSLLETAPCFIIVFEPDGVALAVDAVLRGYGTSIQQTSSEKASALLLRVRLARMHHFSRLAFLGRSADRYRDDDAEACLFLAGLRPELRFASARWVRTQSEGFSSAALLAELERHEDTLLLMPRAQPPRAAAPSPRDALHSPTAASTSTTRTRPAQGSRSPASTTSAPPSRL